MLKRGLTIILSVTLMLNASSCSDYKNSPASPRGGNGGGDLTPRGPISNQLPPELLKPNQGDFSETKMLVNLGLNVIAKNVSEYSLQAALLKNRIDDYCEDLDAGSSSTASEKAAQEQWKAAMLAYHKVAAAPLGPLLDDNRKIAENIYSWPRINLCGIDQDVTRLSSGGTLEMETLASNHKGLGALEYLLFESTRTSTCKAMYAKVMEWQKLPDANKKRDRCVFAQVLVNDVMVHTKNLAQAWDPDTNNFTKTLIDGSREGFKTTKESINAFSDSLFAIEELKDFKLGSVLGLQEDCTNADKKCPEMAEHPWSGLALKAVMAQLNGFKAIFYGGARSHVKAFGFDDYLTSMGHPEVAAPIEEALDKALQMAEALDNKGSLQSQTTAMSVQKCLATSLDDQQEPLCALFLQVREVTNDLKIEVLSALSLSAPPTFQGDLD